MIQPVRTDACEADARSQTDWLLVASNRERRSAHETSFAERVLRPQQISRIAPGRFMLQPSEDSEALELASILV